jgi:hypothetical protein
MIPRRAAASVEQHDVRFRSAFDERLPAVGGLADLKALFRL